MDDQDECIHGLGPVSACTLCNGRAAAEKAQAASERRPFRAKYEGVCAECRDPILLGDLIYWSPEDPAIHAECLA